jgi:hypothetical protein
VLKQFKETGSIPTRESGKYASNEHDEIVRLKRELRDTKNAFDSAAVESNLVPIGGFICYRYKGLVHMLPLFNLVMG